MTGVVKRFASHEVLRGVSLTLHRHEVVCLIGASGSGKSTLLWCANLLETNNGGDIQLFGQSLLDPRIDPDLVRRHMGTVFQSFTLFAHLSVRENVALGPVRALKRPFEEVRDEALSLLARIGLKDRTGSSPIGSRVVNNSGSRSCDRWRCTPLHSCSTRSPARWTPPSSGK